MGYALLVAAFLAERAHQWQAFVAGDWSFGTQGRPVRCRTVIATVLAIGWGEGLGFFVQSEHAFWALVFWMLVAHVVLTAALAIRSAPLFVRITGPLVVLLAALAAALRSDVVDGWRPTSWLGHSHLPPLPDGVARAVAMVAGLAALLLAAACRRPAPAGAALLCGAAAGSCAGAFAPDAALGPVLFAALGHGVPGFLINVAREREGRRLRLAAAGVALAAFEWWLVAKCVWFPDGSVFPDRVDWWDLGRNANFLLLPVWMAPFFAHAAIDAIRMARPSGEGFR